MAPLKLWDAGWGEAGRRPGRARLRPRRPRRSGSNSARGPRAPPAGPARRAAQSPAAAPAAAARCRLGPARPGPRARGGAAAHLCSRTARSRSPGASPPPAPGRAPWCCGEGRGAEGDGRWAGAGRVARRSSEAVALPLLRARSGSPSPRPRIGRMRILMTALCTRVRDRAAANRPWTRAHDLQRVGEPRRAPALVALQARQVHDARPPEGLLHGLAFNISKACCGRAIQKLDLLLHRGRRHGAVLLPLLVLGVLPEAERSRPIVWD